MYYNRKLSDSFSKLLEPNGELRWLFHLVQKHPDLDILIGKTLIGENGSKEWISIYRGLSSVLTILKTHDPGIIKLDGATAYKKISYGLYGQKKLSEDFSSELTSLVTAVSNDSKFDRYYNSKKEGYFQNELSRKFGICGKLNDDFVIIDKEAVIGYKDEHEKNKLYGKIREKYKILQRDISQINAKRYGRDLNKKAIGNELDFLALDKQGNLLLIEYKHGTNTSGIYLSPLQIGMYFDLFNQFPRAELQKSVFEMLGQKKRIGLINPEWNASDIRDIVPVLIVSEYNDRSSAKMKYQEIMGFVRAKKGASFLESIKTYNYTIKNGLTAW
jgi:hypothetical protein